MNKRGVFAPLLSFFANFYNFFKKPLDKATKGVYNVCIIQNKSSDRNRKEISGTRRELSVGVRQRATFPEFTP